MKSYFNLHLLILLTLVFNSSCREIHVKKYFNNKIFLFRDAKQQTTAFHPSTVLKVTACTKISSQ